MLKPQMTKIIHHKKQAQYISFIINAYMPKSIQLNCKGLILFQIVQHKISNQQNYK